MNYPDKRFYLQTLFIISKLALWQNTRCKDVPDTGYISDIRHYLALFKVSGIRPDSVSLSGRIQNIFKVQGNCVYRADSVKIKYIFSIYVKKFGASLKTFVLFRFSTKSRTEFKP